jgi:hypothetical protein
MKKSFAWIVLVTVGFCILYSCSKSNSSTTKTKAQLLTQSVWKYDTAGIDANNDGVIDAALPPGYVQACSKDNLLTFNSDSTGLVDEGPTKCDTSSPQSTAFTWSFNTTQTSITSTSTLFAGVGGDFTINVLNETQLHLGKSVTVSGITVNLAIYLKH